MDNKYIVEGMTCSACVARVEKAAKSVPGVTDAQVSLLTHTMVVKSENEIKHKEIEKAISKAGYKAYLDEGNISKKDNETKKLVLILIASIVLLVPLFYISMGYMLMDTFPNWPLGNLKERPLVVGSILAILSIGIILINNRFYISGVKAVFNKAPNMDTLVALGSSIAFLYSLILLMLMFVLRNTDQERVMSISMNLSFETAGMIPALITIGKTLEAYSKGKTTNAINSLESLAPKKALVVREAEEVEVPVEELKIGDAFITKRGEAFASDGIIVNGDTYVNESMLTGEPYPVHKSINSEVTGGTINDGTPVVCRVSRVGSETTISKIIEMVKESSASKTKLIRIADKVSGIFVPVVLLIALIVFTIWLFTSNYDVTVSIERAISVIVVSCPCALGLATPVAIMVGNGKSAKYGVLFKNAEALEQAGKVDYIVIDKTGTITEGIPEITDIVPYNISENEFIKIAASIEKFSEHPLAKAIAKKTNDYYETFDFNPIKGVGVRAFVNKKECIAGNIKVFDVNDILPKEMRAKAKQAALVGKTPLFFIYDNKYIGYIALRDQIKKDSKEAIRLLNKYGYKTIMLTGDNRFASDAIGKAVGVNKIISEVLPEEKRDIIIELKKHGKVMMIGDGINDAIALTEADVSLAIGCGSDVAIDSANVVLMKSSLMDAVAAVNLSRYVFLNIVENLFWAFIYNIIMIPFVAFLKVEPWIGAAAMSLSSLTVCLNALRINWFKPYKEQKPRKSKVEIPSFGELEKEIY